MKLYKRNQIYYCDHLSDGRRIRFSCNTRSKKEAMRYALEYLSKPSQTTDVLQIKEAISWRERALNNNKYLGDHLRYHSAILEHFGSTFNLLEITATDVQNFKQSLSRFKTASTRNKYFLALSSIMRLARDEYAMDVPEIKFKLEKIQHSRKYIYTHEQIISIISYYQDTNDFFMRDLITILADTGCRLSEALNINVLTDVREGVLTITVNKADLPRSIPLTPRCIDVFKTRTNFKELNIYQVERRFKAMKTKLSLSSEATLHGLRHTFATRLVNKGASIDVVQNLLGHKNIQTTQIYAQITNVRLQDTMKLLQS